MASNKKNVPEVEEYKLKDKEIEKLSQSFASRDEKYIASLGNGYIMNYLTNKGLNKGFAFLTDKRVYFKGSCLSGKGKSLVKTDEERTVDVKNITGSGFIYRRYWGILIALFISILVSLGGTVGSAVFSYQNSGDGIIGTMKDRQRDRDNIKAWETILDNLDKIEWHGMEKEGTYHSVSVEGIVTAKNQEYEVEVGYVTGSIFISMEYAGRKSDTGGATSKTDGISSIEDIQDDIVCIIEEEIDSLDDDVKSKNGIGEGVLNSIVNIVPIPLCLSLVVICFMGFKNYMLKRKTLFRIEYAGGCIAFDVSFYAKTEIDDFQKQLRRVKDFAEETTTIKTVAVETPIQAPTQSSVPDDLRKYADLLKEGLISQEEYDAMKKKILGL